MLLSFVTLAAGLVALVAGAELLVRGASALALRWRISPLVVGLTVVAYGTSSPELAVSTEAAWSGRADIALGNVVGSNIFNVLFILGASALASPLSVAGPLLRRDIPLMIGTSFLLPLLALDGSLGRVDGTLLLAGAVGYTLWCVAAGRREHPQPERSAPSEQHAAVDSVGGPWWGQVGSAAAGLLLLALGAHWLVEGAVAIARGWGLSELVIGLTIVAAGTSLPEAATSIVASLRGRRDIAVGNVVGSNIFNILAVLGSSAVVASHGVGVSGEAMRLDIPVMIATACVCLPVFLTGRCIARWEGGLFLAYYVAYTSYLVLASVGSASAKSLGDVLLGAALPLTAAALGIAFLRTLRRPASLPE